MATINFDERSKEILREVDEIHRQSLINVAIHMIAKTGYYKSLTGKDETLEDITDLAAAIGETEVKKATEELKPKEQPKSTVSWNDFD